MLLSSEELMGVPEKAVFNIVSERGESLPTVRKMDEA